jgi:multiple sugar transport system ATP-binding protein
MNFVDVEAGESLTLGVRPEDIDFGTDATENTLLADVEVLEPVGSDNYHYFTVADSEWTARTGSSDAFEMGQTVEYTFDPRDLYLFDADGTTRKSKGVEEGAYPTV